MTMKSWTECKPLKSFGYKMTASEIQMTKNYIRKTNPNHLQPNFRRLYLDIVSQWETKGTISPKQQDVLKKAWRTSLATRQKVERNCQSYDASKMFDVIANPMKGW